MLSWPRQELKGHFTMLPMDEVHFGSGSLDNLSAELDRQGVSRAVIVTGNSLARNTNPVEKVAAATGSSASAAARPTTPPRRPPSASPTRQAWVAEAMGVDIAGMSEAEAAIAAADEVIDLLHKAW